MPDIAHRRTNDMIDELEKKISSEYQTAAKEVEGKMKKYLTKTEKEAAVQRELLKAGKITKKEYTDWMTRKYAMGARWEELRDNLAEDMTNANKIARSISNGYRADAYALNHNFAMYQAEHDGKCSTVYQLYDRQTVERLMEKDRDLMPPPGKKLAERIRTGKVEKWNHQQLQSALTQSILQGEGIAETARRVARTVATRGYNDSVRYARTMMTGAENAGRNDGFKTAEDMGINLEKEWIATLDDRTRASHAALHGERVPVDDKFSNDLEFPGDPAGADEEVWNCRCTMKASVKGFEHDRVESSPKMGEMSFDEWQESRVARGEDGSADEGARSIGDLTRPERPFKRDFSDMDEFEEAKSMWREEKDAYESKLDDAVAATLDGIPFERMEEAEAWAEIHGCFIADDAKERIDPRAIGVASETLEEMFEKYPWAKEFQFEMPDGSMATAHFWISTTSDGLLSANGGLEFNPFKFGVGAAEYGIRSGLEGIAEGYLVRDSGEFASLVRHEYGHRVQTYIEQRISAKYHNGVDDWRIHFKTFEEYKQARDAYWRERHQYEKELLSLVGLNGSSEYSNVNTLELFAEGFAEYSSGSGSEFGKAFGAFLRRWT